MFNQATGTYTDEAVVESFVGKTVTLTTTLKCFEMSVTGTLVDLNGKGYYQVRVNSDGENFREQEAIVSFNKGTVHAAWVAASGNIIRLSA